MYKCLEVRCVRVPQAEVVCSYEPPGMGARIQTWVFRTSNKFSLNHLVFFLDSRNEKICGNGLRNIDKKEFALNIVFRYETIKLRNM